MSQACKLPSQGTRGSSGKGGAPALCYLPTKHGARCVARLALLSQYRAAVCKQLETGLSQLFNVLLICVLLACHRPMVEQQHTPLNGTTKHRATSHCTHTHTWPATRVQLK